MNQSLYPRERAGYLQNEREVVSGIRLESRVVI